MTAPPDAPAHAGRAAATGAGPHCHPRLWAGTKLIVVAGIGVLLTFYPGWVPIGLVAALVLVTARLARIPRGVLPSVPRWLWVLLFLGGAHRVASPAAARTSCIGSVTSGSVDC